MKKAYQAPRVTAHGDIRALTQGPGNGKTKIGPDHFGLVGHGHDDS